MKRIVFGLFALLLVASFGSMAMSDEILFRNLPWGCSPDAMEKELYAAGFTIPVSVEGVLTFFDRYLVELDRSVSISSSATTTKQCGWACAAVDSNDGGPLVAGYDIGSVYTNFYAPIDGDSVNMRKSDAKLYMAQYALSVLDYDTAFEEISGKLTKLYGEPEEKSGRTSAVVEGHLTSCDTVRLYYYGDNNTVVVMEKTVYDGTGIELIIRYGQTGFDEHIAKCEELLLQKEYQERLVNEQNTDRTDDIGGL